MSIDEARAACEAAGFPLRDRYGSPAPDSWVAFVLDLARGMLDDDSAADQIGLAFFNGEHELAGGIDTPTDEEYELGIITALRGAL